MDYKKSKFRSDRIHSAKYRDNDDDDEYYRRKRSRSRSRSRGRSSSYSDKKKSKSTTIQQAQSNKYEENPNNPFGASPTVEKRFGNVTPSKTLMMRQIPPQMDDNELRTELFKMAVPYKDVRLVKDRNTGLNRGFAFIEFNNIDDASGWMQATKGSVYFINHDARAVIFFSNSADDEAYRSKMNKEEATEWDCSKCGVRNFKRRERCFKCSISREESDKRKGGEGYDYAGTDPCNTLLLRGLDALTTKETILESLNKLTNFTLSIKNVHIARDSLSKIAMGFAFVEMNTIQDAGYLLQCYQIGFEIDGKQVKISYSKNNFRTAILTLDTQSKMSYNQVHSPIDNSSSMSYGPKKGNQTDAANSAAAVAQAAMISMHKKQEMLSHLASQDIDPALSANLEYIAAQVEKSVTPDVSQYAYDETSGFYYDYSTGLYYDPNSQYYYNATTQQYLYYDTNNSSYLPVTGSETVKAEESKTKNQKVKTGTTKPKTAAQIAKDMERWAEQMNKKKDKKSVPVQKTIESKAVAVEVESKPEEVAPVSSKQEPEIKKLNEETSQMAQESAQPLDESKFIDQTKLACLLCKRRFDSIDILNKHVAKSDLHKSNLEKLKSESGQKSEETSKEQQQQHSDSLMAALKYRDRALERRKKYGSPEPPSPPSEYSIKLKIAKEQYEENANLQPSPYAEMTYQTGTNSVASKLMKKMGWSEGSGIGKNLQGISAPIEATLRQRGAGLGATSVDIDPNDSYQDAVKKSARARFEQLR